MVEPAAGHGAHAVKRDEVLVGEEAVEEESDDAAHGMLSTQIECVVDAQVELDCGKVSLARKENAWKDARLVA